LKKLPLHEEDQSWYREGLQFACTGCGKCCTGAPGYVFVSEEEIQEMALFLKITVDEFAKLYLRKIAYRYSLKERSRTYDCVFLQGKECSVYACRPKQCRTYPFWPKILANPESWEEEAGRCEGIHAGAPKIPLETIKMHLEDSQSTTP
jgi:hypothetical protein